MFEPKKPLIEFWDNEEDRYGDIFNLNLLSLEEIYPSATPLQLRLLRRHLLFIGEKMKRELQNGNITVSIKL